MKPKFPPRPGSLFKVAQFTADDWGISPGVNEGILDLAEKGILRRVSLMSNTPFAEYLLPDLKKVPTVEIGLHWNMTGGSPTREEEREGNFSLLTKAVDGIRVYQSTESHFLISLSPWKRKSLFDEARRALVGQLYLAKKIGVRLSYLDSHQHIHLIPGLLDHVAPELISRGIMTVRYPLDWRLFFSRRVLSCLMALGSRWVWRKHQFYSHPCVYPFAADLNDGPRLLRRVTAKSFPEVIVHPASLADFVTYGVKDSYCEQRVTEYRSLLLLQES